MKGGGRGSNFEGEGTHLFKRKSDTHRVKVEGKGHQEKKPKGKKNALLKIIWGVKQKRALGSAIWGTQLAKRGGGCKKGKRKRKVFSKVEKRQDFGKTRAWTPRRGEQLKWEKCKNKEPVECLRGKRQQKTVPRAGEGGVGFSEKKGGRESSSISPGKRGKSLY